MPKRPDDKNGDLDTRTKPKGELSTLDKPKVERPPLYEVLLHNDDYTTQEFVVYVLMKFFQHDATTARMIMLHVHTKGVDVEREHPGDADTFRVHVQHDLARRRRVVLKELHQHIDDELLRGVVVVVQQHLV